VQDGFRATFRAAQLKEQNDNCKIAAICSHNPLDGPPIATVRGLSQRLFGLIFCYRKQVEQEARGRVQTISSSIPERRGRWLSR
jgi:hypothetical protein